MKKSSVKALTAVLLCVVMCFSLLSVSASALSLDKKGSISITCLDRETKQSVAGAVFRLYRIADAFVENDSLNYRYTDDFASSGMEMGNFSDAYLPIHLMAYALLNDVQHIEKISAADGKVIFSDLAAGAYLVVPMGAGEGYLRPSPFIVLVPMQDTALNQWVYDIDASPKVEADKDSSGEKTYISVKKLWQGTGKHPDSIKVTLLKDGIAIETVMLSAENNWYHRWDDLEKKHSWSVVEADVPEGYTVSYDISQMTVIITNSDRTTQEETTTQPDETTTGEDTTGPDDTTNPDETTDGGDTTTSQTTTVPTSQGKTTTKPEELIDTGQLNWPVPVFAIAGLLLFSIGWAMLNIGKKEEV